MANIVINDLPVNSTLDTQALASIVGGMYDYRHDYWGGSYPSYYNPFNLTAVHASENVFAQSTKFAYSNDIFAKQTDFNLLQITK